MNYLLIGFGIVGSNLVDYLVDGYITVVEPKDVTFKHKSIKLVIREKLSKSNFKYILDKYTSSGDIIIDTAVELDTYQLCIWAYENGRHYINTVCDKWLPDTLLITNNYKNLNNVLYEFVQQPLVAVSKFRSGPTCLMGHGANIGMVNHYFKMAILESAKSKKVEINDIYNKIKNVYFLEKDTLVFKKNFIPHNNTFYNTWNILEFIMESSAFADYPSNGLIDKSHNANIRDIFLDNICIHGRLVGHEETYTINEYLKNMGLFVEKIQFLYECSPVGEISRIKFPFGSLYDSKVATYELDDINGYDFVGTLIEFHDNSNWLYGYKMLQKNIIHPSRTNATAWYVSSGVLAGINIIKEMPNEGINFPENLDFPLNQRTIELFLEYNSKDNLISKPISSFFISHEYPTYEVYNIHSIIS